MGHGYTKEFRSIVYNSTMLLSLWLYSTESCNSHVYSLIRGGGYIIPIFFIMNEFSDLSKIYYTPHRVV